MLPKYDSRRSHWLFFGKIRSGLGSRAQRTLERIRPAKGASRTAPFFCHPVGWSGHAAQTAKPWLWGRYGGTNGSAPRDRAATSAVAPCENV